MEASNLDESQWDQIQITYEQEGSLIDIKKKLSLLKSAFPLDEFNVEISFETFSLLEKFEKKLELQYDLFNPQIRKMDKKEFFDLRRKMSEKLRSTRKEELHNLKKFKIIFKNLQQLTIFYSHYEKSLIGLEKNYDYHIVPFKNDINVYLRNSCDESLSSFFTAEIIGMRRKLVIYFEDDKNIYSLTKYSKIAEQKLEKEKIDFITFSNSKCIAFYSQHFGNSTSLRSQVRKILNYHVSVIKFHEPYLDRYILDELMKLIALQLRTVINQIQIDYEMPIEVDIEKAAIVINDKHQVFNDGLSLLKKCLQTKKLMQIQCGSLIQLKKLLSDNIFGSFLKFESHYRRCFLIICDQEVKGKENIIEIFCQRIANFFGEKYRLVLHFFHLTESSPKLVSQKERTTRLAAKHELEIRTFHNLLTIDDYHQILIEPNQLSIHTAHKRQSKIYIFLKQFILNHDQQAQLSKNPLYEQLNNNQETLILLSQIQNQSISQTQKFHRSSNFFQQKNSLTSQIQSNQIINQKPKSPDISLDRPLEYPKQQECEHFYKRGKQDRIILQKLQKNWNRKLKIKKIIINKSIELPKITSYDKMVLLEPKIFCFQKGQARIKKYSQVQPRSMIQFKQGQVGLLSFVNKDQDVFIPLYEVEFVS